MTLSILYRGALSSCNYGCGYCPFAKHHESDEEHAHDARQLERFLSWCERRASPLRVFFTPWGEALTQRRYQDALVRLSRLGHVEKVAIQTNLSARLDFLAQSEPSKLGVWATYHPEWTTEARFLAQCERLLECGVSFSVGVVGFPRFREALDSLRAKLPPHVYVWVNAVKSSDAGYQPEDLAHFTAVDPLFPVNQVRHPSLGRACAGGHSVISVDGEGVVRSCHFIRAPLGNLYDERFDEVLKPRPCAAATCGCHIGSAHLEHLKLGEVFGDGILERNPLGPRAHVAFSAPRPAVRGEANVTPTPEPS
ncbi:MAG: STM4011 family radical SAM protein [Myxococcaceae bacterium]|nr:STM4011 family radical SAM protein [Myxococcaceae bacterium]